MASVSEIQSLEEIQYKSKVKFFLLFILVSLLFIAAFLNFYPIAEKFKTQLKTHLSGSACNPDFTDIRIEWLLPKIVIDDLILPASCLGRMGEPIKFNFVTLNWQIINFSPFGIPFRLDTEISGQPISIYYVIGINEQLVRIKDQTLVLSRLQSLLGDTIKVAGSLTVDLNLLMADNFIKNLSLKGISEDLQLPSQNLQGFTIPSIKLNRFFIDANSENHPRINITQLHLGDTDSPIRANFKGTIDLQEGNIGFSPMNLIGEVAFSPSFQETIPILDMMFQSFTQKDGFYQIRLGGTLGAPKTSAP